MKSKNIFLILFIVSCVTLVNPFTNVRAEENINEIDISTSPHTTFFSMKNLKPGDHLTKELNILNNGKQDFKYILSNKYFSGSEKFYKKLLLQIYDEEKILFKGELSDFNKLDPRKLFSGDSENLIFKVEIPSELGNEYQGLSSEFEFKIYVEGTLGGILPADGPKLPNTGSNIFNILVVGAALVFVGSIIQLITNRRKQLDKQV
ncbi:TasA family protein [Neobacillus sp. YX16]|uniref:TasA family protein n=1 Tax=Neobacillus sp. YX16 TaxID=3047874 RepID=UPI0024C41D8D|nr:TasA family protein [Neobacillus sp. YX16]WHZ01423.1 TasA family protein [Neobacillus sp. YX16]